MTVQIDQSIEQAHKAFLSAKDTSLRERAQWLDAIADALEAHREELIPLGHDETRLPEARLDGELTRTAFQLRLLAEEATQGEFLDPTIDHADPSWGMGPRPDIRRVNVPLGAVGVFGASNFPFAFSVAGGDTASALAAGNAVVHKIHEAHLRLGERTAEIVVQALARAHAPEGIFTAIGSPAGDAGRALGERLVDHPLIKAIGFTGSVHAGRALFDRAAARPEPIPFYGELGSLNPAVITARAWEARPEEIASGFAGSLTMGIGQFCTKPGLLFVPQNHAQPIQEALVRELATTGLPGAMLTERIRDGFLAARDRVAADPATHTAAAGDDGDPPRPALFSAEAQDLEASTAILHQEMFGPAAVVIGYRGEKELLSALDRLPGQLTGTVHAEAGEDIGALTEAIGRRVGRLIRNGWPTGVTVSYAQHHGGPYPATTLPGTSVGTAAISRFTRTIAFQDFADGDLPPALQESNPLGLRRRVDGTWHETPAMPAAAGTTASNAAAKEAGEEETERR